MQEEKYLSIITNFGCHWNCSYCITREGKLKIPATDINSLDLLMDRVREIGANIISVSGGGDPLFEYPKHKDYYDKLFGICEENGLPVEMHTSYTVSDFPYEKCKRVVYHITRYSNADMQYRGLMDNLETVWRHGSETVRVVFVVNREFYGKESLAVRIADYVEDNPDIDELSFRQMVDGNFEPAYYINEFLTYGHKHKLWHYIEQRDYNTYFVNGKLYTRFADIGK